jgi:ElaB/YqjD/DUF883 family membrane-anchored ribosome-binding protein
VAVPFTQNEEEDLNREPQSSDPISTVRNAAVRVLPVETERVDAVANQVRDLDRQARAFVQEHPIATVAAAIGIGFVIGRVLRG